MNLSHNRKQTGSDVRCERLSDYSFSQEDVVVLHIARFFFSAFHVTEECHWVCALRFADCAFGPDFGPVVAKATMEVVNAIRSARKSDFNYCDPRHPASSDLITPEERYFLTSLRDIRKTIVPVSSAMILCEGADLEAFIAQIKRLAEVLGNRPTTGA